MLIYVNDRLILRSLSASDAPAVFENIDKSRADLRVWLPWVDDTDSSAATQNTIARWEKEYADKSDIVLGVFENGAHIGVIGLHDINKTNGSAMIGYWLTAQAGGHGCMTASVRALMEYGFFALRLNHIYIHCAVGNNKSRAIPERLGFVLEGVLRQEERLYGVYHDLVVYGLLRGECKRASPVALVYPAAKHKEAAAAYKQAYIDSGEQWINGSNGFMKADSYEEWLRIITNARTQGQPGQPENCSTYFMFVGDILTGTIQVRHEISEGMLKFGGHIGYGIRPSARRQGYGGKMLALALARCRELGMTRVLITCDKGNIASAKTAMKNGGVLENELVAENGTVVQRYWVVL